MEIGLFSCKQQKGRWPFKKSYGFAVTFAVGFCILTSSLHSVTAAPIASAESSTFSQVEEVGRKWLALLDKSKFTASWEGADPKVKKQVTENLWTLQIQPVREPLGNCIKRELHEMIFSRELPDGTLADFVMIRFKVQFQNKDKAIETVVLRYTEQGWLPSGYFIK